MSSPAINVMIAISDTGTGIPPELIERVFDPFFTTKKSARAPASGSVWCSASSSSRAATSRFTVRGRPRHEREDLPATLERRAGDRVRGASERAHHRGRRENPHRSRPRAGAAVRHDPGQEPRYTALEAANAAEALVIIDADEDIDLLFTDVIMPGNMNGRSSPTRRHGGGPDLKTLFHLGIHRKTPSSITAGSISGVLLLAKPYRKSELAKMLRTALAS